jgi:hypothetical protein
MRPLRFAVVLAFCGSLLAGGIFALDGLRPSGSENTGSPIEDRPATSAATRAEIAPLTIGMRGEDAAVDPESVSAALSNPHPVPPAATPPAGIASDQTPDPMQNAGDEIAGEVAKLESASVPLPDPAPVPPALTPPAPIASAPTPDPAQNAGTETAVEVADTERAGAPLPDPTPTPRAVSPPAQLALAETPAPGQNAGDEIAVEIADMSNGGFALSEDHPTGRPPARLAALFTSDPVKEEPKPVVRPVETANECLVAEICIDEYLWSLYARTPKVDMNKVTERFKAIVKKKGKTLTVMKTRTKYVLGDFTWKDPIAAQRFGMSVETYVIGGMDRSFKLKLYYALRAMDDAGLMPGISSAFRDDYRQSIAVGNKAASDSSYHGGSRRGGYGHGLAADLVSVKGETRLQRYASSKELWQWIDAHEKELGIGRPYLDRDPPHVGPTDGKEYSDKRGVTKSKLAGLATNRRATRIAFVDNRSTATRRATK